MEMTAPFSSVAVKKGRETFSMVLLEWEIEFWDQEWDIIRRKQGLG